MLTRAALGPARGQITQQHVRDHGLQADALPGQPACEVQQIKRISADAGWRVAAVGQIAEIVVAQLQVRCAPPAVDTPSFPAPVNAQPLIVRHGTLVTRSDPSWSTRHAGMNAERPTRASVIVSRPALPPVTSRASAPPEDWPVKGGCRGWVS